MSPDADRSRLLAIGADGCRGGWVAALAYPTAGEAVWTELRLCANFEEHVALRAGTDAIVAVDIPMGLLGAVAFRPCDEQARKWLGRRASTVFAPPSRPLLEAADYKEVQSLIALAREQDPSVKGLSAQSAALIPKVAEADRHLLAHPEAQEWLWECHPELSFFSLHGGPLDEKRSAHGQLHRLELVAREFDDATKAIREARVPARAAGLDDVLDAYAALHTALVVRAGEQEELGGDRDACGLSMRMAV
jgi:predicted RNase H-like nuclease